LRNVDGKNYVTSVKSQSGGTCWAHAVIACMEGNLLMTNNWEKAGETDKPNLAEYHLDWWNGFNTFFNDDVPSSDGLTPHQGAQCRIAAAYFARGEGAVFSEDANDETELDYNWYNSDPDRFDDSYHIYYPRDIEIYDVGENLENIDLIKNKIMTQGPINIVFRIDYSFLDENYVHYQPSSNSLDANHNVVIVGWDDDIVSSAPGNGAWLQVGVYTDISGFLIMINIVAILIMMVMNGQLPLSKLNPCPTKEFTIMIIMVGRKILL